MDENGASVGDSISYEINWIHKMFAKIFPGNVHYLQYFIGKLLRKCWIYTAQRL